MRDEHPFNYDSVHASHCCTFHGCKYCMADCPVTLGHTQQLYPCADCDLEKRIYGSPLYKLHSALLNANVDFTNYTEKHNGIEYYVLKIGNTELKFRNGVICGQKIL